MNMRKLKITIEEPNDPINFPRTNVYITTLYGEQDCWALYISDSRYPEIRIIKQGSFLRTAYLLVHELGHWILDCILISGESKNKWNLIYDKIDRKIVKWK